jgi:AraC-like DNA-binding protein
MVVDLHTRTLHRSRLVVVRDVSCHAARGQGGPEECSASDDIVFPRRGAFVRVARGRAAFGDASAVLFFNRGESYQVAHPVEGGDDCTVFTFARDVLADALGRRDEPAAGAPATFPRAEALLASADFAALQRLRRALRAGRATPLEADEAALEILAAAARALDRHRERPVPRRRPETARAHRETVLAARALLARDFPRRLTLDRIAAAVAASPFHLARLFVRETGLSIHRHLTRLRLRAALERLADGADDLTSLALDLGFSSHSHFTDAFRAELGVPPAEFRRGLASARPRETSKKLEAPGRRGR